MLGTAIQIIVGVNILVMFVVSLNTNMYPSKLWSKKLQENKINQNWLKLNKSELAKTK